MRKRAAWWILFSVMIWFSGHGVAAAEKKGPIMKMQSTEFDSGAVNEGAAIRHTFIVSNGGDELLEIQKVVPG